MQYTLQELIQRLKYSLKQTPVNLSWLKIVKIKSETFYDDAVENIQAFLELSSSANFTKHILNNVALAEQCQKLHDEYLQKVYAWSATEECHDITLLFVFISHERSSICPPLYVSDAPELFTLDVSLVDLQKETSRESLKHFLNENPLGQCCVAIKYGDGDSLKHISAKKEIAHQLRMNKLIDHIEQLKSDYNNTLSVPSLPESEAQLRRLLETIKRNTHKFTKIEFQESLVEDENNAERKVEFIRQHFAQSVRIQQQGFIAISTDTSEHIVTEYFREEHFSNRIERMLLKQIDRLKEKNNSIATDKATRLENLLDTILLQQKLTGLTNNPSDYVNLITEWERHNLLTLSISRNPSTTHDLPRTVQKIAKICGFLMEEIEKYSNSDRSSESLLGIQYYEIISKLSNRMGVLRQELTKKSKPSDTRELSSIPYKDLILNPNDLSRTELKIKDLEPLCESFMALPLAERTAINVSNIIAQWEEAPKPSNSVKRRRSIFKAEEGTTEKMINSIKQVLNLQISAAPQRIAKI